VVDNGGSRESLRSRIDPGFNRNSNYLVTVVDNGGSRESLRSRIDPGFNRNSNYLEEGPTRTERQVFQIIFT